MLHLILTGLLFLTPANDADLLKAVPADAQVVVSIESVSELSLKAEESAWGKFFTDPQMKDFIDYWLNMADLRVDSEDENLHPARFWNSVDGGLTVFATIENIGEELIGVGVLAEPGAKRDVFDDFLDSFKDFLTSEGEDLTDSVEQYADREIQIFESAAEEGDQPAFLICDTGEAVLAVIHSNTAKGLELVRKVVDLVDGEGDAECILDSTAFQSARDMAKGAGLVELFVDTKALITLFADEMRQNDSIGEMEGMILKAIGFSDLTMVYATAHMGEGEAFDSYCLFGIEGEGALRGFVDCVDGALPRDLLKVIPTEAISASTGRFDLNGFYGKIMDVLRSVNEDTYNSFRGAYDMFLKQQYGVDPEKEILALSDGRWGGFSIEVPESEIEASSSPMMTGGSNLGSAFLVGLTDTAQFQANLEKVFKAVGLYMGVQSEEFQGRKIYIFSFPGMAAKVHWVFGGDVAAFSLYPSVVRAFVRVLASDDQPSVLEREDYLSFLERASDSSWFTVGEVAANLKNSFTTLQFTIQTLAATSGDESLSGAPFPDTELVDKYFKGVIASYVDVDEKGVHMRVVSR